MLSTKLSLNSKPTLQSGRAIKLENEIKVLKAIRFFGHLRRSEIALAVWKESASKSAYVMASRTVKSLLDQDLILKRPNILGGFSFILNAKGVAKLKSMDISASEGYELSFGGPQFFHRTLGTCYLLEKAKRGDKVYGEYAVLKGWSPLDRDATKLKYSKAPDGLIIRSGKEHGLREGYNIAEWVEVESAFKSYKNVKKALDILLKDAVLDELGTLFLDKIVFVYDSRQRHENQLLRYISRFISEAKNIDKDQFLESIIFARCFLDVPLVWYGAEELSAKELLSNPSLTLSDSDSVADEDSEDDVDD